MRRRFLVAFFCVAALGAGAQSPQPYPTKPLRLIVPDGPGSVSDLRARQVSAKLGELLGGSMMIGAEAAARSPADGYTLFFGNIVTHSLNPLLFKSVAYKPEDFVPVTSVSQFRCANCGSVSHRSPAVWQTPAGMPSDWSRSIAA